MYQSQEILLGHAIFASSEYGYRRIARSISNKNLYLCCLCVYSMFQKWMVCMRSGASKCNVSSSTVNAQFDQTKSIIERTCIDRRNGTFLIYCTLSEKCFTNFRNFSKIPISDAQSETRAPNVICCDVKYDMRKVLILFYQSYRVDTVPIAVKTMRK